MKLILKKDQAKTMLGKVAFKLKAKVELTPEESELVTRYKVDKLALHDKSAFKDKIPMSGMSIGGKLTRIAVNRLFLDITIGSLINGVSFSIKDISEILEHEESIKTACEKFKIYLEVMKSFGGEEIINYDDDFLKDKIAGVI